MATTPHDRDHSEHAPHVEATEARAGERGIDMVWVLVVSGVLAAVALFVIWAVRAPDPAAESQAAAPQADAELAPAKQLPAD